MPVLLLLPVLVLALALLWFLLMVVMLVLVLLVLVAGAGHTGAGGDWAIQSTWIGGPDPPPPQGAAHIVEWRSKVHSKASGTTL